MVREKRKPGGMNASRFLANYQYLPAYILKRCRYYNLMVKIKIRLLAEERKISADQLAALSGMSRRTIYNIYEHRKCPTVVELERFAEIFGVYIEDLYESPYSKYYVEDKD